MKNPIYNQVFHFKRFSSLFLLIILISGGIAFAAGGDNLKKGDVTTDGLTVIKSTRLTETQIKKDVKWSEYTKYQITPVEVSFRKNWKRDYNRDRQSLSMKVTDKDMLRIKETVAKIVREEFDRTLQDKGGLTATDEADSSTLLLKPRIIDLDVYAPDVESAPPLSHNYVKQAGQATLFLEVYDAVSGEILGRWVDTREDPDRGYFEWANRITNAERVRIIVGRWVSRLVEGMDKIEAAD